MSLLMSDTLLTDPMLESVAPLWPATSLSVFELDGEYDDQAFEANHADEVSFPWPSTLVHRWLRSA